MHVSKKNVSLRELCPKKMSQREENARIRAKLQNGKIGSKWSYDSEVKLPSFCNCPSPYPVPFENKVAAQVKILKEIATEMSNKKTKQTMDKGVTEDKYTCWCHARDMLNARFEIFN